MPTLQEIRQEQARRHLLDFTRYTLPGYQAGWVHRDICQRLERFLADVIAKRSPRLMLFMPPRHGKSELSSRRFPAWSLGRHQDLSIIGASYAADLARLFNRDVQRIIDSDEYRQVFPGTTLFGKNVRAVADGSFLRNSDIFEVVGHKGVYRGAGIGGGITGMGADILDIDDPIKDAEQAESEAYREACWAWYTSTAYTRLMPGGGVLLTLTRWHEDDLAGRLLKAARHGDGDQWEVVSYPAIAEEDEPHRQEGEALHPERYSLEQLQAIKRAVGTRVWTSLYQQHPTPPGGAIVKANWFKRYGTPPANPLAIIQSWDTANKAKQRNDFWVCTTWAVTDSGYYLLDVCRKRMEYPEGKRTVKSLYLEARPAAILIEDASSGQSLAQELAAEGLPVIPLPARVDKVTLLMFESAAIEAGLVHLPEAADWLIDYEAELTAIPNTKHDDQGASTAQFLNWIRARDEGEAYVEYYDPVLISPV